MSVYMYLSLSSTTMSGKRCEHALRMVAAEESGGLASRSATRPEWALIGKVNQNMETIVFKEKFIDWPEAGKLIRVKDSPEKQAKV